MAYPNKFPPKKVFPLTMSSPVMKLEGRMAKGSRSPASGGFSFAPNAVRFNAWFNHDDVEKGKDPYFSIDYDGFGLFLATLEEFAKDPMGGKKVVSITPQFFNKDRQQYQQKPDTLNVIRGEDGMIGFAWRSYKQEYPAIIFEFKPRTAFKIEVMDGDEKRELTTAERSVMKVNQWVRDVTWLQNLYNPTEELAKREAGEAAKGGNNNYNNNKPAAPAPEPTYDNDIDF